MKKILQKESKGNDVLYILALKELRACAKAGVARERVLEFVSTEHITIRKKLTGWFCIATSYYSNTFLSIAFVSGFISNI